jgi:hypothetical protein
MGRSNSVRSNVRCSYSTGRTSFALLTPLLYTLLHKISKPCITEKVHVWVYDFVCMEQQEIGYVQLDFFGLLPGAAGGRALRALKGNGYFAELARTAATNRSKEERQEISQKSQNEHRRRLYHIPRTVCYLELDEMVTERIVPWWPHQKNRQRRKRPVFVRIELERSRLTEPF